MQGKDHILMPCWGKHTGNKLQTVEVRQRKKENLSFDCVDHNQLRKTLKEMGIPDHLTCLLRNLYAAQKQQLELDMEQQTGSK